MGSRKDERGINRRELIGMAGATAIGGMLSAPAVGARSEPSVRVIDFRARPNTREYLALFAGDGGGMPKPEPLAGFIAALDSAGVGRAVFPGRQSTIMIDGHRAEVILSNDYVAGCIRAYPDRLIGLVGVDPAKRLAALREIDRGIALLGMKGVSIDLPGVQADDRMMYPIYYKCMELNVPVVITQGPRMGNLSNPRAISTIADELPDLKIVCSHAIYPQVDEWIALAFRSRNIFIEASMYHFMPGAEAIFAAANGPLQDKIIYGSAFPFAPLADVDLFKARMPDAAALDKVLYRNAAGVLGIA